MKFINIKELGDCVGDEVTVKGWVYNIRSSGKIAFLQIRDGSGFTQAIVEKSSVDDSMWEVTQSVTMESSVEITGIVSSHPKMENTFEIQVSSVSVIHTAEEYPISKKEHGPDFLLDNRHLWIRSKKQWAILRLRSSVYGYIEEYLREEGFVRFDSPIITPSACEGTTELFEFEYFDLDKAYLSQSGQLYLEAGIGAFGRVYDFGPVFRAEKSKTRRHLTEFWMMDAEAAFVEHEENMKIQENLVHYVLRKVLENNDTELEILKRDKKNLEKALNPFLRMTHKEAITELKKLGSDIREDDDLGAEDEKILTEQHDTPIFIEKYPAKVKAFYMKRDPEDESRALCSDLLAPEGYGEIFGGSERESDYDVLLKSIHNHNLPEEDFKWYLDARRYGSVPHSGFGIGLERLVAWIGGVKHVRETIPFPRMITRKSP